MYLLVAYSQERKKEENFTQSGTSQKRERLAAKVK